MRPLISVIVPVYNVQPYLRQCLDSLTGQTLHDIEIICVDDGSTDGSPDILAEYAEKDSRVRVITQANAGVCTARNAGMDAATAPYLMFCDSDDRYLPAMCAKMHAAIEKTGVDIVICETDSSEWRESEDKKTGQARKRLLDRRVPMYGKEVSPAAVVRTAADISVFGWAVWHKIYRQSFLKKYDIRFPAGLRIEDQYFTPACLAVADKAYFLSDELYYYRRRSGSWVETALRKSNPHVIDYIYCAFHLRDFFERHRLFPQKFQLWATQLVSKYETAYDCAVCETDRANMNRIVADYVQTHLNLKDIATLPQLYMRKLARLGRETESITRRFPIKIVDRCETKKVYFLGIPLWRVKYRDSSTRYYLLNFIRLYKRILRRSPDANLCTFS